MTDLVLRQRLPSARSATQKATGSPNALMTRKSRVVWVLGLAWSYEFVPASLGAPIPPAVHDIEHRKLELPFANDATEALRCVRNYTRRRHKHFSAFNGIAGNRQNPRSSNNEDLFAIHFWRRAGAKWTERRTFLEIGAFDGVSESNTIVMERCLNWRGVLIEPNPVAWAALKKAGRTHSTLVHASPMCRNETTVLMSNVPYTSSVANPEEGGVAVPCVPLTDILLKAGHRRIDFFSLDVEGLEERVLAALDLKKIDVALVFAESINRQCNVECPKRDAVRQRMAAAGYALNSFKVPNSDVFVREDLMGVAEARRILRAVVR